MTGSPAGAADPWRTQRRTPPEDGIAGRPVTVTLPSGSQVWRIHSSVRDPAGFDTRPCDRLSGGRFSSPSGRPGVLYAADSLEGAAAEVLLRDVPLTDEGARAVLMRQVKGRTLSVLEVVRDMTVIALHGPALAEVGQGLWLTKSDSSDYPLTRLWAMAMKERAPDAAGFVWRARHDEDRFAYAFYDDVATGALRPMASTSMQEGPGLEAVRLALLAHRAVIEG